MKTATALQANHQSTHRLDAHRVPTIENRVPPVAPVHREASPCTIMPAIDAETVRSWRWRPATMQAWLT